MGRTRARRDPKPGTPGAGRVALLSWSAESADRLEAALTASGWRVERHAPSGGPEVRPLRERPPDAVVVDLERRPSHGVEVASYLRQLKPTRHVPLLFAGGDAKALERVRARLPDAAHCPAGRVRSALRAALRARPQAPVVPDLMAGYSGRPLAAKLRIGPGVSVALRGAPDGFERALEPLPAGVRLARGARRPADVVLFFARTRRDLLGGFSAAVKGLAEGGALWIAWPKQASGLATDLTQAAVRELGLSSGLVDYKICAIDATWSGLCFARRREREGALSGRR